VSPRRGPVNGRRPPVANIRNKPPKRKYWLPETSFHAELLSGNKVAVIGRKLGVKHGGDNGYIGDIGTCYIPTNQLYWECAGTVSPRSGPVNGRRPPVANIRNKPPKRNYRLPETPFLAELLSGNKVAVIGRKLGVKHGGDNG